MTLESARSYRDLLGEQDPQERFSFETIFDDSTFDGRWRSKWKFSMLRALSATLEQILDDGEKVRYLSRATRVSFMEAYFLGWMAKIINRRALVVTDSRLLFVQVDRKFRPGELLEQIRYCAIRKVSRTLLGRTRLELNDGRRVVFAGVPRADRLFLAKLIGYTHGHITPENAGVEDLCPHCFTPVNGRPPGCLECGGAFKSVRTATIRSLIFPGLGDWYLGHRFLAGLEMAFAALMWVGMLIPSEEYPLTAGDMVIGAVVVFVFIHIPDALLTRYIANRGLYPLHTAAVPALEDEAELQAT